MAWVVSGADNVKKHTLFLAAISWSTVDKDCMTNIFWKKKNEWEAQWTKRKVGACGWQRRGGRHEEVVDGETRRYKDSTDRPTWTVDLHNQIRSISALTMHPSSTIFFLCDVQTKFSQFNSHLNNSSWPLLLAGPAIHGFEHIVSTANKMLKLAKVNRDQLFTGFTSNSLFSS